MSVLSSPPKSAPARIRRDPRWLPLLVSAAMVVLLVVQVATPPAPDPTRPPPAPRAIVPPQPQSPPQSPESAEWSRVLDRPLFSPDRRPTPTVAAATALEGFVVTGIAVSEQAASAVVRPPAGKTIRLRPGQTLDGWTVRRIAPQRVTLDRAGESLDLTLDPKGLRSSGKGKEKSKGNP
ncbi:hypothetical protein [Magnetospirillum fulvum]|nr:hypothetical protein [Magnetospirillum fulvum]